VLAADCGIEQRLLARDETLCVRDVEFGIRAALVVNKTSEGLSGIYDIEAGPVLERGDAMSESDCRDVPGVSDGDGGFGGSIE
jgi:hypothetical protein